MGKLHLGGSKCIYNLYEKLPVTPELKAKYLQYLNQKKQDEGFTLIELLVVIIIIGILSAIALPAFLNQTAKAKQSEAKTNISSVNSAQTAYRTENNQFASTFDTLALGTLQGSANATTTNYSYTIAGGDTATIIATARDTSLKAYAGGTQLNSQSSQSAISSVMCEAISPGTTVLNPPTVAATGVLACDNASYKTISQ